MSKKKKPVPVSILPLPDTTPRPPNLEAIRDLIGTLRDVASLALTLNPHAVCNALHSITRARSGGWAGDALFDRQARARVVGGVDDTLAGLVRGVFKSFDRLVVKVGFEGRVKKVTPEAAEEGKPEGRVTWHLIATVGTPDKAEAAEEGKRLIELMREIEWRLPEGETVVKVTPEAAVLQRLRPSYPEPGTWAAKILDYLRRQSEYRQAKTIRSDLNVPTDDQVRTNVSQLRKLGWKIETNGGYLLTE